MDCNCMRDENVLFTDSSKPQKNNWFTTNAAGTSAKSKNLPSTLIIPNVLNISAI